MDNGQTLEERHAAFEERRRVMELQQEARIERDKMRAKAARKWVLMNHHHEPIGVFDSIGLIVDALEAKHLDYQLCKVDQIDKGRVFTMVDRFGVELAFYATVFVCKNVI